MTDLQYWQAVKHILDCVERIERLQEAKVDVSLQEVSRVIRLADDEIKVASDICEIPTRDLNLLVMIAKAMVTLASHEST